MHAGIAALARARCTRPFPGKVLVVSEFGAEANRANPPGTPGLRASRPACSHATSAPTGRPRGSTAMLVWTLRDFALRAVLRAAARSAAGARASACVRGINQKGLFTYDGRPKPAVAAVRRAFGG